MQWYELYPIKMNGGGENAGKTSQNLDANVYATKKTIAQGLLDVALLTANASQLKYLLQLVLTGCMMLLIANTNLNEIKKQRRADNLNNAITIGIFLVAILNILIAALGIKNSDDLQAAVLSTLGTSLQ
ncbi:ninjurin-2 [Caerostris extrusa]|uniref:Ninjurin-2 n=1 Tax=Caerostris extrusa TaxID=172846 RepID=A0AAV4UI85_CAEEX|nr:ninjurin-2 [Caerostris extrusa]